MLKEKGYLDIIRRCFSQPTVPEIMKALSLERNPWAHQGTLLPFIPFPTYIQALRFSHPIVLARLKEQCPLSLVITLRALQESSTKSLGATLRRDYRIALRFMVIAGFHPMPTIRCGLTIVNSFRETFLKASPLVLLKSGRQYGRTNQLRM